MSHKSAPPAVSNIGIDLGKNSFHLVGLDQRGAIVWQLKCSRAQLERRLANIPCCLRGMEACSGAHYIARQLAALGHDVARRVVLNNLQINEKKLSAPRSRLRGKRLWIHLAFSELRQPNVSLLFLLKALMQDLLIMAQVELASQSRHGAISCDLVMFELLSRCDKPHIANLVALQHSEHHFSFIYKRLHGLVGMRSWVRTMLLQD